MGVVLLHEPLAEVRRYVQLRVETDYVMPLWLPFLPYILLLVGVVGFVAGLILTSVTHSPLLVLGLTGLFLVLTVIGAVVNIYVVYKWVKRRNEHFKRRLLLTEALLELAKTLSDKIGKDATPLLREIERELREARYDESEKNAVLWALIQLIPYIGGILMFYVYHFLNRDFLGHFRREVRIIEAFRRVFTELGAPYFPTFTWGYSFPDRSTVLYIVLTLLTAGLFGLYWIYTLTKDPNEHFKEHLTMEREMLDVLEALVRSTG